MYAIKSLDKQQGIGSEGVALPENDVMPRTILLVDSQEDQGLILASLLSEEGYHVTACDGASEALDLFEKEDFDLVIVVPPVFDSHHLLEQLKPLESRTSVLVLSSQYETER